MEHPARHHDAFLVPLRHALDACTQGVKLLDAQLAAPLLEPTGPRCFPKPEQDVVNHQKISKNGGFNHQKWWFNHLK